MRVLPVNCGLLWNVTRLLVHCLMQGTKLLIGRLNHRKMVRAYWDVQ